MDVEMEILQVKKNYHQIFECPVCKEFMSAPILLCTKGHSICSLCLEKVRNCPLCQAKFTSGRNFSLELLAESATFPCENSNYGCHEAVFLKTMNDHHKVCAYRLHECVTKRYKCKWKGRKPDILAHVEEKHKGFILMKQNKAQIHKKHFSFDKDCENCKLIRAYGEIFLFQSFINSAKKEYYISVHYIGSPTCSNYFYKIHCIPARFVSSKHEILFTTRIHPETVNIKDLIKDNISCFCLKQDMAEFFMVMGALKYKIEIIKVS